MFKFETAHVPTLTSYACCSCSCSCCCSCSCSSCQHVASVGVGTPGGSDGLREEEWSNMHTVLCKVGFHALYCHVFCRLADRRNSAQNTRLCSRFITRNRCFCDALLEFVPLSLSLSLSLSLICLMRLPNLSIRLLVRLNRAMEARRTMPYCSAAYCLGSELRRMSVLARKPPNPPQTTCGTCTYSCNDCARVCCWRCTACTC